MIFTKKHIRELTTHYATILTDIYNQVGIDFDATVTDGLRDIVSDWEGMVKRVYGVEPDPTMEQHVGSQLTRLITMHKLFQMTPEFTARDGQVYGCINDLATANMGETQTSAQIVSRYFASRPEFRETEQSANDPPKKRIKPSDGEILESADVILLNYSSRGKSLTGYRYSRP